MSSSVVNMNIPVSASSQVGDTIILEEEIDPNYVPSEDEIVEYAKWLGMDLEKDKDMFWIAKEGLIAPLPKHWKPCKTKETDDIYYFNFDTGESTWDHPCDEYYKRLYEDEKKKKNALMDKKSKSTPQIIAKDPKGESAQLATQSSMENNEVSRIVDHIKHKSKVSSRLAEAIDTHDIPTLTDTSDTVLGADDVQPFISEEMSPSKHRTTPERSKSSNKEISISLKDPGAGRKMAESKVGRQREDNDYHNETKLLADEVNSLHKKLQSLREERNRAKDERDVFEDQINSLKVQTRKLETSLENDRVESDKIIKSLEESVNLHSKAEVMAKKRLEELEGIEKRLLVAESEVGHWKSLYEENMLRLHSEQLKSSSLEESNQRLTQLIEKFRDETATKDSSHVVKTSESLMPESAMENSNQINIEQIIPLELSQSSDLNFSVSADEMSSQKGENSFSFISQVSGQSQDHLRLTTALKALSKKYSMACDDIMHLQEKIEQLETDIASKSKALHDVTEAFQDERRKLADANDECTSLRNKLSSVEQSLSSTCSANDQLKKSLDVLTLDTTSTIAIRAKDALTISELQLKVTDLQAQLRASIDDAAKQKALSLENSLISQQQISAMDRKHAEVTTQLNKERALSDLLRNDLKTLQLKMLSEEQMLQESNIKLMTYSHDLETKLQDMALKQSEKDREIIQLREKVEELNSKCRGNADLIHDYEQRFQSLQEGLGNLHNLNKDMSRRLESIESSDEFQTKQKLTSYESLLSEKESELSEWRSKYASLLGEISQSNEDMQKLQSELLHQSSKILGEIEIRESLERNMKTERETWNSEKSSFLKIIETKDDEIVKLANDIKSIQDRISGLESKRIESDRLLEINDLLAKQQAAVERLETKIGAEISKPSKPARMLNYASNIENEMYHDSSTQDSDKDDSVFPKNIRTQGRASWRKRLAKESALVSKLEKIQKNRKIKLRLEQKELEILRDEWRSSKLLQRSISSNELNHFVAELNKAISKVKSLDSWLAERKRKLQYIERIAATDDEEQQENVRKCFQELDLDLKKYGDSLTDETESSDVDYLSDISSPIVSKYMRASQPHPTVNKWVDVPTYADARERFSMAQSSTPTARHLMGNLETMRKVLRNLSNDQRSSEKAYDDHAEWLQSLQREVGEFQASKENYLYSD